MNTKRFLLTWCWLLLALILPAVTIHAQAVAPNYMSYQGYLTDGSGTPLGNASPQAYSVVFRIYNNASSGSPLYSELQTVTADKGNFSILLGQGVRYNSEPFGSLASVFASAPTFIEMTILGIGNGGGSVTLAPRLQLVSTPYAFSANTANQVVNASGVSLLNSSINGMNLVAPVGINTSTPRGLLDFAGVSYVSPTGTFESGTSQNYFGMIETFIGFNDRYGLAESSGFTTLYTSQAYAASGIQFGQATGQNNFSPQMTIAHNGYVGIGSTSPLASLELGYGANSGGSSAQAQMDFAWSSGGYRHFIQSRHTGAANSAGNGIDFYLNNSATAGGSTGPGVGNVLGLSITAVGVGIYNQNPGFPLDVNGSAHVAGNFQNDGLINASGGYLSTAIPRVNTQGTYLGWNHGNGDGGTWLVNQRGGGGGGINFCESDVNNNYTTRMVIAGGTGYVGIGTTGPNYPLDVEGNPVLLYNVNQGGSGSGTYGYTQLFPSVQNNHAGGVNSPAVVNSGGWAVSIYTGNWMAGQGFVAFSDARIKNVIGRSDSAADLAKLSQIEITDYKYKDEVANTSRPQKKVIAQQVEKVYPLAVNQGIGVVPDIYKGAVVTNGWVQLATDLKVGERVKLIGASTAKVCAVLETRSGAFRTDGSFTNEPVVVYGREVKDFRTVDYDALAMLNVSATQELAKRLATVEEREAHLAETEAKAAEQARQESASEMADLKQMVVNLAKEVNSLKLAATERNQAAQQQTATARLDR